MVAVAMTVVDTVVVDTTKVVTAAVEVVDHR